MCALFRANLFKDDTEIDDHSSLPVSAILFNQEECIMFVISFNLYSRMFWAVFFLFFFSHLYCANYFGM